MFKKFVSLSLLMGISLGLLANDTLQNKAAKSAVSATTISEIRTQGLEKSQVMNFAWYLTDVVGPRLTVSTGFTKAANWAAGEFKKMGLTNIKVEPWGEFGRGWDQEKCYIAMTAPYYSPLVGQPKAFTAGTPGKGVISSEVVVIDAADSAEFAQKYKGKLKGKVVMQLVRDTLEPSFNADGKRYTEEDLVKMTEAKPLVRGGGNASRNDATGRFQRQFEARRIGNMIVEEEPALILDRSQLSSDGTVFISSGGSYKVGTPIPGASIVLNTDDYLRIQRLVTNGVPVKLDVEVRTKVLTADTKGYNVIAEIQGSDPVLKNEIVMLGAHLDSWTSATGATDNAAGSAVMMEVMRIIKSLGEKPKRTIRVALWSGEEQGLLGSRAWVAANVADPADMKPKGDHSKISAYYNLDNGTGRVRGIYSQQNEGVGSYFTEWLKPFHDLDAKTVTISNTGGTDHLAFDAVGVPGFQFIQDPIEYNTRTHHTNMDNFDHLVGSDLRQASTVIAAFVMNTAQLKEKMPRKEMPEPRPARN